MTMTLMMLMALARRLIIRPVAGAYHDQDSDSEIKGEAADWAGVYRELLRSHGKSIFVVTPGMKVKMFTVCSGAEAPVVVLAMIVSEHPAGPDGVQLLGTYDINADCLSKSAISVMKTSTSLV